MSHFSLSKNKSLKRRIKELACKHCGKRRFGNASFPLTKINEHRLKATVI